ncbi:MAG: hypothetical protein LBT47_10125 [Deltaproteobacteria bacterium]|jgi:hypothetical protein|nr:hypothetical protein [Deltaproteobacteria bacterium]
MASFYQLKVGQPKLGKNNNQLKLSQNGLFLPAKSRPAKAGKNNNQPKLSQNGLFLPVKSRPAKDDPLVKTLKP